MKKLLFFFTVFDVDNNLFAATKTGAFKSTNAGASWVSVLPQNVEIFSLIKSADNGASWQNFVEGMTPENADLDSRCLALSNNGILYTGTVGIGLFKTSHPITAVENEYMLPNEYGLSQNYPNPFNPRTIIRYQIPADSFVKLRVYDILGNEIATLVNEEKSAGFYEIEFTRPGLASGIYIYRINSGNFSQTKKMTLLR